MLHVRHERWLVAATLLLAPVLHGATPAHAQPIQPTAQARSIQVTSTSYGNLWDQSQNPFFPDFDGPIYVYSVPTSLTFSAVDLQPFAQSRSSSDPGVPIVGTPDGTAQASQSSSIAPLLVQAEGAVASSTDSYLMTVTQIGQVNALLNPPVPYFYGNVSDAEIARSSFSVTFDVVVPTAFSLTGSLDFLFEPPAPGSIPYDVTIAGFIDLSAQGGPIVAHGEIECALPECFTYEPSVDVQGMLAPGTYVLSAQIESSAASYCYDSGTLTCYEPGGSGGFAVELATEPPAVPALGLWGGVALASVLGATASGCTLLGNAASCGRKVQWSARESR